MTDHAKSDCRWCGERSVAVCEIEPPVILLASSRGIVLVAGLAMIGENGAALCGGCFVSLTAADARKLGDDLLRAAEVDFDFSPEVSTGWFILEDEDEEATTR